MKILLSISAILFALVSYGQTTFDQLVDFNPNWQGYKPYVKNETSKNFKSDQQLIQFHLKHVLKVLEAKDVSSLSKEQRLNRQKNIEELTAYRKRGLFPMNYYREERIPVFIDEFDTHCAVGYLLKQSGYESIARGIAKRNNYAWVRELGSNEELLLWQASSGLTIDELKLIQGAYDFYMPMALTAPNRYEIPQKPEIICKYFDKDKKEFPEFFEDPEAIWIRGEGKNGKLHGKWEQNYLGGFPWIKGFFEDGKKSGQWYEYYPGSEKLCRTEHWRNDKLNGVRTRYDREGNIIEEILFKDGMAVRKTNYELMMDRKYVRIPLDSNLVRTEVYTLTGALIAKGKEEIYNPGNLQWFQNIELTALNTAAISAQQISITNTGVLDGGLGNFYKPPLVQYKKVGEWTFFKQYASYEVLGNLNSLSHAIQMDYGEYAHVFNTVYDSYDSETIGYDRYDSIQARFDDNYITWMKAFGQVNWTTLSIEYEEPELQGVRYFEPSIRYYHRGPRYQYELPTTKRIKAVGRLDQDGCKIGLWKHFDDKQRLIKTETFMVPYKPQEAIIEEEETKG